MIKTFSLPLIAFVLGVVGSQCYCHGMRQSCTRSPQLIGFVTNPRPSPSLRHDKSTLLMKPHPLQAQRPLHNENRVVGRSSGSSYQHSTTVLSNGMMGGAGGIDVGIKTAQLLIDPRRHSKLKRDLAKAFPLVPESVIESCVKVTAETFQSLAPDELKSALKPGGIEKYRPQLHKSAVNIVLQQNVIQDIPILSTKDKSHMVEWLVDLALDQVLAETDGLLVAPEYRLAALEAKIRDVKEEMGWWRLFAYRVRKRPVRLVTTLMVAAMVVVIAMDSSLSASALSMVRDANTHVVSFGVVLRKQASMLSDSVAPVWSTVGNSYIWIASKVIWVVEVVRKNVLWAKGLRGGHTVGGGGKYFTW